ncbi:hypothetical protein PIB30_099718, partial [Stylosanthes scabra]|nr:hypothetical protein [Stylosanthes scabra]
LANPSINKTDISSSLPFPSIIAALCADAKIPAIPDDTLIPQEPPIVVEAMTRTREPRAKNPRQTRQATPPQQQPQKRIGRASRPSTQGQKLDGRISQTLDLGKYTESYQVIYHNEVEYQSHED